MEESDRTLITAVRNGEIAAFEELYRKYYTYLCLIAKHIVRNQFDSEEIVSDVFMKLWRIRDKVDIEISIKAYLVKATRNTSVNYLAKDNLRNKSIKGLSTSDAEFLAWDSDYPLGALYTKEIMDILNQGVNELPDGCREVFILSRDNEMKYNEIAEKLGISVNTVKGQMKIALGRLRANLKDYLMLLF